MAPIRGMAWHRKERNISKKGRKKQKFEKGEGKGNEM